jgi:hypothetical protein
MIANQITDELQRGVCRLKQRKAGILSGSSSDCVQPATSADDVSKKNISKQLICWKI